MGEVVGYPSTMPGILPSFSELRRLDMEFVKSARVHRYVPAKVGLGIPDVGTDPSLGAELSIAVLSVKWPLPLVPLWLW